MAGRTPPTPDRSEATSTPDVGAVGHVSRTVGTVFRYLLLAMTLVGIVALTVLLVFVTNDAIRPLSAEPAWLAAAGFLVVALPAAVAGWLATNDPRALRHGFAATGLAFVGVLYAGGVAVVFTDVIPPTVLFAYTLGFAVPTGAALAFERVADRVPFGMRLAGVGVIGAISLWWIPRTILSLPFLPADWVLVLLVLGLPAAAIATIYVRARSDTRRPSIAAGIGSFALCWALGGLGVLVGVNPSALTVLGIVGLVPVALYVTVPIVERDRAARGGVLPLVVVGGIAGLLAVERLFGLAGPAAWLTWGFLTSLVSAPASEAGIYPGIAGTILLMIVVVLLAFPVGVGAAVYLEEYARDTWFTRVIEVNISNLAGVPSVVYGLLGLGAFVRFGGLAPGTILVGGMTLALLVLPIVVINSREALRAVPDSRRRAAYGMGTTRWQAIRTVVLPEAFPAILTGTILALGRAVGETAPLLVIGAPAIFGVPGQLGDRVGAIPLQIYTWASTFADEAFFTTVLAAGVVTILVVLLTMNAIAIVLRNRYQRDT